MNLAQFQPSLTIALQAVVGSIAWAFYRLKKSWSRKISATRFIAYAPNFPFFQPSLQPFPPVQMHRRNLPLRIVYIGSESAEIIDGVRERSYAFDLDHPSCTWSVRTDTTHSRAHTYCTYCKYSKLERWKFYRTRILMHSALDAIDRQPSHLSACSPWPLT